MWIVVVSTDPKKPIYFEFSEMNQLADTDKNCDVLKYTFLSLKFEHVEMTEFEY